MGLDNPTTLIIILVVVLLLFGGKKIPELMRGLGKGIREFKDAKDNVQREIEDHMKDDNRSNSTTNATSTKQVSAANNPGSSATNN